jgi:hypothetical protein
MMIDKSTAQELVRHALMYIDRKYPNLELRSLHSHSDDWGSPSVTERSFWTEFYADILKNLPYVEGTEHKFDDPETMFDVAPNASD